MVLSAWATAAFIILVSVTAVWILSLLLRDASIADIFWGLGFVVVVWTTLALHGSEGPRPWLVTALATCWGLRLAWHILVRNWGRGEDFRYRKWREEAGRAWWWRSYVKVFLTQGATMWIVALPLVAVASRRNQRPLGWLDAVGIIVFCTGLFFEAVGDWQLTRFRANPANRGQVMTTGLWRYTRHPNYFGDATVWWGHYLVAVAAGAWWTILSPALMTFLLMRVSGVAMLESSLAKTKPGYREYVESTSAFFPRPPRRRSGR